MKKITLLIFLCFSVSLYSQSKDFVLIDILTKQPIDLAQVSYPSLEIGSVSNEDGRIRIPLKKESIYISHINYIEKTLSFDAFEKKDTLFLSPRTNQLDEIIISNLDIKSKVLNILENTYFKKYSTKKTVFNSTYKETFSINDTLTRLFQIQLDWYSKNYLFKADKAIEKQNVFNFLSVDFSKRKIENKDFLSASGAHVENISFFKFLHLNFLLEILEKYTQDFEIISIDKNKTSNNVTFNAILKEKGKTVFEFKNSLLVFDKDYNAIKHLKFDMVYNTDFKDAISTEKKKPYQKKITNHIVELSFKELNNKKLAISYFISDMKGIIKTDKFTNHISAKQSLFVGETSLGKKLKNGNIELSKAFYKSIPKNIKNEEVKYLLTNKEKEFLNSIK